MRVATFLAGALLSTFALSATANAEVRLALVIGNGDYVKVGDLTNPVPDAGLIKDTLTKIGFTVTELDDASQKDIKRAITQFGTDLESAGPDAIGLFFYAGHGVQINGVNYLIPVDAEITKAADVDVESVNAQAILDQMKFANKAVNIIILDACRDNPFPPSVRDLKSGLALMDPPTGSFLAFSTSPGDVAEDGFGKDHSPYASALAEALVKADTDIEIAFRDLRVQVRKTTKSQTPWEHSSLTGPVRLNPVKHLGGLPTIWADSPEAAVWKTIEQSQNSDDYEAYLTDYPKGVYATLARSRIEGLQKQTAPIPAAPSEQQTADEPAIQDFTGTYAAVAFANVRAQPTIGSQVIGKLQEGDLIPVTGEVEGADWLRVDYTEDNNSKTVGFVSAHFLAFIKEDEAKAWRSIQSKGTKVLEDDVFQFLLTFPGSHLRRRAEALVAIQRPQDVPVVTEPVATNGPDAPVQFGKSVVNAQAVESALKIAGEGDAFTLENNGEYYFRVDWENGGKDFFLQFDGRHTKFQTVIEREMDSFSCKKPTDVVKSGDDQIARVTVRCEFYSIAIDLRRVQDTIVVYDLLYSDDNSPKRVTLGTRVLENLFP